MNERSCEKNFFEVNVESLHEALGSNLSSPDTLGAWSCEVAQALGNNSILATEALGLWASMSRKIATELTTGNGSFKDNLLIENYRKLAAEFRGNATQIAIRRAI